MLQPTIKIHPALKKAIDDYLYALGHMTLDNGTVKRIEPEKWKALLWEINKHNHSY